MMVAQKGRNWGAGELLNKHDARLSAINNATNDDGNLDSNLDGNFDSKEGNEDKSEPAS